MFNKELMLEELSKMDLKHRTTNRLMRTYRISPQEVIAYKASKLEVGTPKVEEVVEEPKIKEPPALKKSSKKK